MEYHYHIAMKNFILTIIISVGIADLFCVAQLGNRLVFLIIAKKSAVKFWCPVTAFACTQAIRDLDQ